MINLEKDILWSLFSAEEKTAIVKAIEDGNINIIPRLPDVRIDTPAKEKEIEKIVLEYRGVNLGSESEVRNELKLFWQKEGKIETPEQEQEWQKKIDSEIAAKKEAIKAEKDKLMKKKDAETDFDSH